MQLDILNRMGQPGTKFTGKNSGVALALPARGGSLCVIDKGGSLTITVWVI